MPKSPRSAPNPIRVIDVLTYPAVQLLDVTGPVQVFASANDLVVNAGGTRPYQLKVVAQGGEGATASAGVTLAAASTLSKATPDREKLAANAASAQSLGALADPV